MSASWGDLRPAPPSVRAPDWQPFADGLCHNKVWVFDRNGRATGEVECHEPWGHPPPCRSSMYQWIKGTFRIRGYGSVRDREHDPRRRIP
jgi:hypothetical protein